MTDLIPRNKNETFESLLGLEHSDDTLAFQDLGDALVHYSTDDHDFNNFQDFIAHYGVLGMKWGIRKDRNGRRRPTEQVLAEQKKRRKGSFESKPSKSNRLSDNPRNRRMSDQEMRKLIDRLNMERQLNQLTATQKAPPSRVKTMMKDVAFDVVKGASTEVGKAILSQALRVEFNKRASSDYRVPVKVISDAIKDAQK